MKDNELKRIKVSEVFDIELLQKIFNSEVSIIKNDCKNHLCIIKKNFDRIRSNNIIEKTNIKNILVLNKSEDKKMFLNYIFSLLIQLKVKELYKNYNKDINFILKNIDRYYKELMSIINNSLLNKLGYDSNDHNIDMLRIQNKKMVFDIKSIDNTAKHSIFFSFSLTYKIPIKIELLDGSIELLHETINVPIIVFPKLRKMCICIGEINDLGKKIYDTILNIPEMNFYFFDYDQIDLLLEKVKEIIFTVYSNSYTLSNIFNYFKKSSDKRSLVVDIHYSDLEDININDYTIDKECYIGNIFPISFISIDNQIKCISDSVNIIPITCYNDMMDIFFIYPSLVPQILKSTKEYELYSSTLKNKILKDIDKYINVRDIDKYNNFLFNVDQKINNTITKRFGYDDDKLTSLFNELLNFLKSIKEFKRDNIVERIEGSLKIDYNDAYFRESMVLLSQFYKIDFYYQNFINNFVFTLCLRLRIKLYGKSNRPLKKYVKDFLDFRIKYDEDDNYIHNTSLKYNKYNNGLKYMILSEILSIFSLPNLDNFNNIIEMLESSEAFNSLYSYMYNLVSKVENLLTCDKLEERFLGDLYNQIYRTMISYDYYKNLEKVIIDDIQTINDLYYKINKVLNEKLNTIIRFEDISKDKENFIDEFNYFFNSSIKVAEID